MSEYSPEATAGAFLSAGTPEQPLLGPGNADSDVRGPAPRVWLVTGASRGLGRAVTAVALQRGDHVVATAREPHQITEALGTSDALLAAKLDVTAPDEAHAAVAAAVEHFGRIDVVVNNAGYGAFGAVEEISTSELERLFATNVTGTVNVTRAALPYLRAQRGGHLLNVSSLGGFSSSAGWGVYGASKAAVEGLSEALHAELGPLGIAVTIIDPGFFRTEFLSKQSLIRADAAIPDYGASINRAAPDQMHHRQPGDPARAAAAIHQLVATARPPLRLALGSDALHRMREKLLDVAQDLHRWEGLSRSTAWEQPSMSAGRSEESPTTWLLREASQRTSRTNG